MDMDLIPEAVDLYAQLGVKKKPLELIAPQFETPTPKLHPAVFPPALRDLAPPPLDLFDLEEEFSGAQHKLNALFQRCQGGSDEDLRVFIEEGARICGVGGEGDVGDGNSADAALIAAFRKMVQLKTRSDDFDGEEQGEEDEG
jgi:intraflagellar transport protein 52